MFKGIGFSVYLSNYQSMKQQLSSLAEEGCYVFTSFHISEEFQEAYSEKMKEMCRELREMGYQIIGDVSKKTLQAFSCHSIIEFAVEMGLSVVRIDYGFTEEEIIKIGKELPICVNASTLEKDSAQRIAGQVKEIYAMHNFYPRPETGLDVEFFERKNQELRESKVKILAFIPGDIYLRKPLMEGLPTLESHRSINPYAAYVDMKKRYQVDGVFVGDGIISKASAELIQRYNEDKILRLPMNLRGEGEMLKEKQFTIRADSPRWLKRFQESREYSCFGSKIRPAESIARKRGSLTVDNERYLRYSGEVQLIIKDLPEDERVNVIGCLEKEYDCLLENIQNGDRVEILDLQNGHSN